MKKCLQALKPAGSAGQLPRSLSEAHGVRSIAGSSDAWSSGSGGTYGGDPCHRRVLVENPSSPRALLVPLPIWVQCDRSGMRFGRYSF